MSRLNRPDNLNLNQSSGGRKMTPSSSSSWHIAFRWLSFLMLAALLIIPFQNFGPRPQDSVEQAERPRQERNIASFVPSYKYDTGPQTSGPVKVPEGYVPSGKIRFKSSSEDIPDEEWIKGMENKFLLKFDPEGEPDNSQKKQTAVNTPAQGGVLKQGRGGKADLPDGSHATDPTKPRDQITWQLIDREGKGKFQYDPRGPVKVEADYNVSTGEGVLKVLRPFTPQSQVSVEANSKNASETLNFNFNW